MLKKREEKASRRTRKKLLICIRMFVQEASVRNRKPEAERASQNQECQENKCSGAEERTKDACSPQIIAPLSLLSSCSPHQLTQLQQTSPMLSSTTCQLKP